MVNPLRGQGQVMLPLWLQHADEAVEQSMPYPGWQKTPSLGCCPDETWTSASALSVLEQSMLRRRRDREKSLLNKCER